MLSGDNGILQEATKAKESTDSAQIKERVRLAYNSALTRDLTNGNGDLTKPTLDEEINNEFGSSGKVEKDGDEWVIYVDNKEIERISIPESALTPTLISQGAKVGDYVNYDATSGNGAGLQVTASDIAEIVQIIDNTDDSTKFIGGATISGTFKSNEISKWRIVSIENGIIKLMAEVPTSNTVTLLGKDGYKKAKDVLDKISSIYGKGNGATSASSITLEDLDIDYDNIMGRSEQERTYTSGIIINDNNEEIELSAENPVTIKQTAWGYGGPTMFKDQVTIWEMFRNSCVDNGYWFTNRGIWCYPETPSFHIFAIVRRRN